MEDRLAFAMLNLVGRHVEVRKVNGCVLSGVFCSSAIGSSSPQTGPLVASEDGLTLRYACHIGGPKPSKEFGPRDRIKISWDDVETLTAHKAGGKAGWEASAEDVAAMIPASAAKRKVVETDTKIASTLTKKPVATSSGAREGLKAVPQEWLAASTDSSLGGGGGGDFDQFKVNETKFGVKSTYKEEMYTTELDRSRFTPEQVAKAERAAREIESASTNNSHVLEERGKQQQQGADGWEDDEEAKFGAVLGSGGYEKYKPPQKRSEQIVEPPIKATPPPPKALLEKPPTPTPPPPPLNVSKAPLSYASMVRGDSKTPQAPTAKLPPSATSSAVVPPIATPGTNDRKKSVSPMDPEEKKKSREDEIRKFKEFSVKYVSPSTKPARAKGMTPEALALEQSPTTLKGSTSSTATPEAVEKKPDPQQQPQNSPAAPVAVVAPSAVSGPVAPASDAAVDEKKKKLNPGAKSFNPSAPTFVPVQQPIPAPMTYAPQPTMMMIPPGRGGGVPPRMIPMPGVPPPGVMPGQQIFFANAPPMQGYMMPMQMPYAGPGGAGARQIIYYPPAGPQMYGQQMLIPVPAYQGVQPRPMMAMPQLIQQQPPRSPQLGPIAAIPIAVAPVVSVQQVQATAPTIAPSAPSTTS